MEQVKGIVMDITPEKIVLFTPEGQFIDMPRPQGDLRCGQEITCPVPRKRRAVIPAALTVAAAAVLIFFMFITDFTGGLTNQKEPAYGYLALDINPSVELSFNAELEVTEFQGINREGETLLEGAVPGEDLSTFLEYLLERAVRLSYLSPDHADNLLMMTLVNPWGYSVSGELLENLALQTFSASNIGGVVGIHETNKENRQAAREQNISLNRYLLQEFLKEKGAAPGKNNPHTPLWEMFQEESFPGKFIPVNKKPAFTEPEKPGPSGNPPGEKLPDLQIPPEKPNEEDENNRPELPPQVPDINPGGIRQEAPPEDIPLRKQGQTP